MYDVYTEALTNIYAMCMVIIHGHWLAWMQSAWKLLGWFNSKWVYSLWWSMIVGKGNEDVFILI